jgi:hypothetical protein
MRIGRTQIIIRLVIVALLLIFIFYTFLNGGHAG